MESEALGKGAADNHAGKGEQASRPEPAFYKRRRKRGNEICQILIRNGDVEPEQVRQGLKIQEERGGQIGRILVQMGACTERAIARALIKQVQLKHAAGGTKNASLAARENPAILGIDVTCSPNRTVATLLLADFAVLAVAASIGIALGYMRAERIVPTLFHYAFPALLLVPLVFALQSLYSATAPSPPEEIRLTTTGITAVYMGDAAIALFGMQWIPPHVHVILTIQWALAVVAIPITRALVRRRYAKKLWWGHPVVVLGAGKTGRILVRALLNRPQVGLRPVVVLDDDRRKHGTLRASFEDNELHVNSIRDVPVPSLGIGQGIALLSSKDVNQMAKELGAARDEAKANGTDSDRPSSARDGVKSLIDSDRPPGGEPTETRADSNRPVPNSSMPPPDSTRGKRDSNRPAFDSARPPKESSPSAKDSSVPPRSLDSAPPSSADGMPSSKRASSRQMPPRSMTSSQSGPRSGTARIEGIPESLRSPRGQFSEIEGVPVIGSLELAPILAHRLKIPYAILAMPGLSSRKLLRLTERAGGAFSTLLVIPDMIGFASLGVPAKDVAGVLGIEVLLRGPRFAKRLMDIAFTFAGGIFVLPVIALLALLIKLDSTGPVFYPQQRLGRDGQRFTAMKFRTMHGDGEKRLKEVLDNNAAMRAEYLEFHKLSFDPRVTRIGRVLRKYSLDELPQLWNVIRGEMSLVGPRPYLEREIPDMEHQEGLILRAMPGMTGMWQVSDRNSTGFSERVKMDVHYVRNWSPWLDIYILARTLGVVVGGTGT
jgi:lipopolysaccharide/colanic/teichoic acid biosynthesis glycosyltransferase